MTDDAGAATDPGADDAATPTDPDTDGEGTATEQETGADYGGLLGAIRYAFGATDSWLMRSYVVVGTLLVAFVALLFVQGVVVLVGRTVGLSGGTLTLSRAFIVVIGLFVVGPLLAPMVSTARRHRHGAGDRRTDAVQATLGYLIALALYVALVITAPPELRDPADGALGPIVETLYALSPTAAVAPLAFVGLAFLAVWLLHRRAGARSPGSA